VEPHGQDVPGETPFLGRQRRVQQSVHGVSLVIEMRNSYLESPGDYSRTKPLAIYVPRKFVQGEQLGRRRYKMEAIQREPRGNTARLEPQLRGDLMNGSRAWIPCRLAATACMTRIP